MEKNKQLVRTIAASTKENKIEKLKNETALRNEKIRQVLERRKRLDGEKEGRINRLAEQNAKKQAEAKEIRENSEHFVIRKKLQVQWAFLIAMCSRLFVLSKPFNVDRDTREKRNQYERVKRLVKRKLMPKIISKRRKRVKEAWTIFKK